MQSESAKIYPWKFFLSDIVNDALARYPFKEGQKKRICWQPEIDFKIQGKSLLVTHILFNLIKNALHHIAVAENSMRDKKGQIFIWLEANGQHNKLFFKDTGIGISQEKLPYIFERFFSQTPHGAGIGLTYCKMAMEALKGEIHCDSVTGEYTLFCLTFPPVVEK